MLLYTYQHHQPASGSSQRLYNTCPTPSRSRSFSIRIFWNSCIRYDTSSSLSTIYRRVRSLYFLGDRGGTGRVRGVRFISIEMRTLLCLAGECSVFIRSLRVLLSLGQKLFLRVKSRGTFRTLMESFGEVSTALPSLSTDGLRTVSAFLTEFFSDKYSEMFSWQSLVRSLARCALSLKINSLFFFEQQRVRTWSLMVGGGCGDGSGGWVGLEVRERFLRRMGGWKSGSVCLGTMLGNRLRLCIINISLPIIKIPLESKITLPILLLFTLTY